MKENYFDMKLSSNGQLYDGVTHIKIRPLLGKDEEFLAESSLKTFDLRLYEMLADTISGVEFNQLSFGDLTQIMMWHASNSFEDEYVAELVCALCEKTYSQSYRLSDLETIYLPDEYEDSTVVELENGSNVRVHLLRVKHVIEKLKLAAENIPTYLYTIACTFKMPHDEDIEARTEFLRSLSRKDVMKIRGVQDTFYHGPKLEQMSECTHCEARMPFSVPFRFKELF